MAMARKPKRLTRAMMVVFCAFSRDRFEESRVESGGTANPACVILMSSGNAKGVARPYRRTPLSVGTFWKSGRLELLGHHI